jgi:hypothetical protein
LWCSKGCEIRLYGAKQNKNVKKWSFSCSYIQSFTFHNQQKTTLESSRMLLASKLPSRCVWKCLTWGMFETCQYKFGVNSNFTWFSVCSFTFCKIKWPRWPQPACGGEVKYMPNLCTLQLLSHPSLYLWWVKCVHTTTYLWGSISLQQRVFRELLEQSGFFSSLVSFGCCW